MNVIQYTTSTNGNIIANNTQQDLIVLHNATALAAVLTFTLPTIPVNGQIVTFSTKNGVTLFTLAGGTLITTISTLLSGSYVTWVYSLDASSWFRIR